MTIADKLQTIADNMQLVYDAGYLEGQEASGYNEGFDAGKKAEYDAFWDAFQKNGERINYRYAFYSVNSGVWDDATYNPKHPIVCDGVSSSSADSMFYGAMITDTKVDIDVSNAGGSYTFLNCSNLKTVRKLIASKNTTFNRWFDGCTALETINFEGVIANDINLQWSTKLSHASIESILWAAYERPDPYATPLTVTLSKTAVDNAYRMPDGTDGSVGNNWVLGWEANRNFEIRLV